MLILINSVVILYISNSSAPWRKTQFVQTISLPIKGYAHAAKSGSGVIRKIMKSAFLPEWRDELPYRPVQIDREGFSLVGERYGRRLDPTVILIAVDHWWMIYKSVVFVSCIITQYTGILYTVVCRIFEYFSSCRLMMIAFSAWDLEVRIEGYLYIYIVNYLKKKSVIVWPSQLFYTIFRRLKCQYEYFTQKRILKCLHAVFCFVLFLRALLW